MARSVSTDYLHNMRFHVIAMSKDGKTDLLGSTSTSTDNPAAGFKTMDMPALSNPAVTYKEGIWVYERKYPGIPSYATVKMSRGVARNDSYFYLWLLNAVEGNGEYRSDIEISIYHRDSNLVLSNNVSIDQKTEPGLTNLSVTGRKITLHDAFPVSHTFGSNLDATSAEISIMDLEIAFERVTIDDGKPAPTKK